MNTLILKVDGEDFLKGEQKLMIDQAEWIAVNHPTWTLSFRGTTLNEHKEYSDLREFLNSQNLRKARIGRCTR